MKRLIILGLFILVSCGEKGSKSVNSIPFPSSEPLTQSNPGVVADSELSPGMGLLLTKKPGSVGLCTSFLISPDHIMTNSHCVTDISLTEDCGKNVSVHMKTETGSEFRSCKKIVSKSSLATGSFLNPDFAVIELSSPILKAKPFVLSREGIQEGIELNVESIDFQQTSEGVFGQKKISQCIAQADSMLGNFSTALSSIIPLFGDESLSKPCRIIHGNSGSPVFNKAGKVISVVFATVERDKIAATNLRDVNLRESGLATNLACLKIGIPAFDALRSAECDAFVKEEANFNERLTKKIQNNYDKKNQAMKAEILKNLPQTFQYDLEENQILQNVFRFTPVPVCIVHSKRWTEEEKLKIVKIGSIFKKRRTYSTNLPRYSNVVEIQFDEFFRPSIHSTIEKVGHVEWSIHDLNEVEKKNGSTQVTGMTTKTLSLCQE